jgi:hypothetical protein
MMVAEVVVDPAVNDVVILFILALVGLICGIIGVVQSRLLSITSWGLSAISLAGVLYWWPS